MTRNGKKRIEILSQKIYIRWGEKEIKIPLIGALMILGLVAIVLIFLYSDWHCGPVHHDASDVPKIINKESNIKRRI